MYIKSNDIIYKLNNLENVNDSKPTLEELKQIRNIISEGMLVCKKLYEKSGSVDDAIKLYYRLLYSHEVFD